MVSPTKKKSKPKCNKNTLHSAPNINEIQSTEKQKRLKKLCFFFICFLGNQTGLCSKMVDERSCKLGDNCEPGCKGQDTKTGHPSQFTTNQSVSGCVS